jgi:hypothetical protein
MSISAQQATYRTDTLTNVVNDTVELNLQGNHAAISIVRDVVSGSPSATLKVEGSVAGIVWFSTYMLPGSTNTPTTNAINIDSEDVLHMSVSGNFNHLFGKLRLITTQTGTGAATYKYRIIVD